MFGSKSKYFFTAAIILMFVVLAFTLFFMTQYNNVHVFYIIKNGEVRITEGSSLSISANEYANNMKLFKFFTTNSAYAMDEDLVPDFLRTVYDFQISASKFNDLYLIYFIVGLICVGSFYLFDNHKRKTYYISNAVVGITAPLTMVIFSIVMLVKNLSLLSNFEKNKEIYQITSVMQDPIYTTKEKDALIAGNVKDVIDKADSVNSTTLLVSIVLISLVAIYFTFLLVFSLLKYKATAKTRKEVIERAVNAND